MKVLIACEESQEVCKAFRNRGHEAYSCDIQEPSGGHLEWHILGDAIPALRGGENRDNGRRDARNKKVGPADSASSLHISQQCRCAALMEGTRTASRQSNAWNPRPRFIYEILVGGYSENMRRKPDSKQGILFATVTPHVAFPLLPQKEFCGIVLPAARYTADYVLVYADGTVEVVEIKSKFTRRAQRDYIYRRRLFIDLIAEPKGYKFTEIITPDSKSEVKEWKTLAAQMEGSKMR